MHIQVDKRTYLQCFRKIYGIKLKLSACVEVDVEENQRCYVHIATNAAKTIATTQAKSFKMKLSRNI